MKEKIPKSKILVLASIVAITFAVSILLIQNGDAEIVAYDGPPKAAIIDQLYDEIPNEKFHEQAIGYLEKGGYQVDVFTTSDITVDFYKNLPQMNYEFVVVRTHGVEDLSGENSMIFTGEFYSEDRYISEQLMGHVKRGTPLLELSFKPADESSGWVKINETTSILKTPVKVEDLTKNEYFVIGPKFVNEAMNGKFQDTTFILGGCNTLSNPALAKSLVNRGASSVVGWNATVGNSDNDGTMMLLLKKMFEQNMQLDEAVNFISQHRNYDDMPYPASLEYYSNSKS